MRIVKFLLLKCVNLYLVALFAGCAPVPCFYHVSRTPYISGIIVDSISNSAVSGISVSYETGKAISDQSGRFVIMPFLENRYWCWLVLVPFDLWKRNEYAFLYDSTKSIQRYKSRLIQIDATVPTRLCQEPFKNNIFIKNNLDTIRMAR